MNIIESIGKWGVKTTNSSNTNIRFSQPRSGDIILFTDEEYPHYQGKYGRIEGFETWKKGEYHICCELGSAFLREDGSVSISGGPFESVPPERLEPTYNLYSATYWNFGNNLPGAGMGVYYKIERPVFRLLSA